MNRQIAVASIVLLLAAASPLSAQHASALRVGVAEPLVRTERLPVPLELDAEDRGTYWKEGALILGIPAAIGMFLFSSASDDDSPGSAPLRDGLVAGLIAGAFGGLIGFFIPKR